MSFKPWLFLVLFALIDGAKTQQSSIQPLDDEYVDSEIISQGKDDAGEERRMCWEMGGVTYNRETINQMNQTDIRISALKRVKNDKNVTVYNFGSQFKSEKNSIGPQGTPSWMVFEQVENIWKSGPRGYHYCQRILHYKCLNDMVINTTESLELANKLQCHEFHGDLVLSGLGYSPEDYEFSNPNLTFIKLIEKIRGRLIIIGLNSNNILNFENLKEVGQHERNKTRPSILIDANALQSLMFPQLDKCSGGSPKECIHIGYNIKISDTSARDMIVIVGKKGINKKNKHTEEVEIDNSKIHFEPIPKEEKMKIHHDGDMKKKGWTHDFENWSEQAWKTNFTVYLVLAGAAGVGLVVVSVLVIRKNKKCLRVDPEEIEKRDDQEYIEIDEDYFKVDNNNNNNNNYKNSAMDDLGSL
ncbi:unnamed protein product [Caenorhabditis brenneri]